MAHHCQCPDCGKALRVADERVGSVVKCPQCGARFRATDEPPADEPPEDQTPAEQDSASPRARARRALKPKSRTSGNLQPFLRYWLTGCGVVLAIAALLGIGGLFSEPLAITASLICVVAILACGIVGMIWMAIDVAKENVLLGLGVLLMPPVGLVTAYQKQGPARRGAIVYLSLVAPTLLLGVMLLVYLPKYTGTGQRAARTATWVDLMHKLDGQVRPETPVVTVALRVAARPGSLNGLQPECEALLLQFKSYVPGSMKIDADARIMTYQYRGHENFKTMIAFYLSSQTGAFTPQAPIEPGEK